MLAQDRIFGVDDEARKEMAARTIYKDSKYSYNTLVAEGKRYCTFHTWHGG